MIALLQDIFTIHNIASAAFALVCGLILSATLVWLPVYVLNRNNRKGDS